MTWGEYIKQCAKKLADATTAAAARAVIADIERELAQTAPPANFWDEVLREYKAHPKEMIKEALEVSDLNNLIDAVEQILQGKTGKKP